MTHLTGVPVGFPYYLPPFPLAPLFSPPVLLFLLLALFHFDLVFLAGFQKRYWFGSALGLAPGFVQSALEFLFEFVLPCENRWLFSFRCRPLPLVLQSYAVRYSTCLPGAGPPTKVLKFHLSVDVVSQDSVV